MHIPFFGTEERSIENRRILASFSLTHLILQTTRYRPSISYFSLVLSHVIPSVYGIRVWALE